MEFSDYLRILRRNWVAIAAATCLGLLVAGVASLAIQPTYTAHTQLFVSIQGNGTAADLQQGNNFSQARVQSYVEAATTPAVLQPAIDSLGLDISPAALRSSVSATVDLNTVIISIAAEDESPVQAAALAQATANSLIKTIERLETPSQGGVSPVRLSIITPATAPNAPSAPSTRSNIVLGTLSGLALGIGFAFLRNALDTKLRAVSDLRRVSEAPFLGGISFDSDATKKPLLTQAPQQGPRAESFRQIRTNLQFAHVNNDAKAILITSSLPGEGKSTTATNLAIAMAQAGQSVVLVDADLRRPRIDDYLGLDKNAGLTTALIGQADVSDLLQPWGDDNLYVLTSGRIPPNPSELLGSDAMRKLISRLESKFDAVVIDAPPLLPVTDAAVLAQQVGGVVLVVGSARVKTTDVQKSLAALSMVQANLSGIVMNLLPAKGLDAYSYSYYDAESARVGQEDPQFSSSSSYEDGLARSLENARNSRGRRSPIRD